MNTTTPSEAVRCATCEIEVAWPPVVRDGNPYCCAGCAAGGPCSCSYDTPVKQRGDAEVFLTRDGT